MADISALASLPHLQDLTIPNEVGDLAVVGVLAAGVHAAGFGARGDAADLSELAQLKVLWLVNLRGVNDLTPSPQHRI